MLSHEDPRPLILLPPALPQQRLTVAFRLLLAFPLLVWLVIVAAAALLGVIVGWFVVLVTGRLPEGLANFLAGFVELNLRVNGYLSFVTGDFPSFSIHPAQSLDGLAFVVTPAPLNRLAVLFRLLLVAPKLFISGLALQGLFWFSALSWLITLVLGRLPVPIHNAACATIRYSTRVAAYLYLLTPEYPRELFGDRQPMGSSYGAPSPNGTALTLTGGERTLVVVFMVLGLVVGFRDGSSGVRPTALSPPPAATSPTAR